MSERERTVIIRSGHQVPPGTVLCNQGHPSHTGTAISGLASILTPVHLHELVGLVEQGISLHQLIFTKPWPVLAFRISL